jgi:xanthine dehydrogenase accessory factor
MALTLAELRRYDQLDEQWILVTIVRTRGSTPRELGANMLVQIDAAYGTIGGGRLEFEAIKIARELLVSMRHKQVSSDCVTRDTHADTCSQDFSLGARLGQCCGGQATLWFEHSREWTQVLRDQRLDLASRWISVGKEGHARRQLFSAGRVLNDVLAPGPEVVNRVRTMLLEAYPQAQWCVANGQRYFLEPHWPNDFKVWVFGAGHVGQRVTRVLATLPAAVTWVDSRAELLHSFGADNVELRLSRAPELEVAAAPAGTYYCVMTHSHTLDADVCEHVLRRFDHAYLGLIGSRAKRASFEKRWHKRGLSAEVIASVQCPIVGLARTAGLAKDPGVIALGLATELLASRDRQMNANAGIA